MKETGKWAVRFHRLPDGAKRRELNATCLREVEQDSGAGGTDLLELPDGSRRTALNGSRIRSDYWRRYGVGVRI